ncbi:MAG: cation diffusion facilitator family transporter [Rhodospirillales bacterium]
MSKVEKQTLEDQKSKRLMRFATYASVAVASILICIKTGAWLSTDSLSLLASLVDSILDVGASLISLIAVHHALRPADKEHRFGHGKAEAIAGLAQSAFILGSGIFLLLESVERFINPVRVLNTTVGISIMIVAILMTIILVGFQTYVVRKTQSIAIKADTIHYQADLLVNLTVILSLILSTNLNLYILDPIFASLIIVYMSFGAYQISIRSLEVLMDKEFPDSERDRIKEIAMSHKYVLNVHDMRTRSSGATSFIQFHAEMPNDILLVEAHKIADEVMFMIEEAFPNTEVFIHQDPEGIDERRDTIK